MNLRKMAKFMGLLSNARETLISAGVSADDLKGVDFSDMNSIAKVSNKIRPVLIKKNPQFAQMVKNSDLLDGKQKEVIDML